MFCRTVTRVSCPWSARHNAEVWLKRHGKRTRGILFPLQQAFSRRSGGHRRGTIGPRDNGRLCQARLDLSASAQRGLDSHRRRSWPPGIATPNPQTGRERPRVWDATAIKDPSHGVAHVLSARIAAMPPAAREACVLRTALRARNHASPVAPYGRQVLRQTIGQTCA
jgi:hypothetical protein